MKHQQVSVDYWSMGKTMVAYAALTALVWIMLRLFSTVLTLPGRLRGQQQTIERTLRELQARYPDMNITEEDLKSAEKEMEDLMKEHDTEDEVPEDTAGNPGTSKALENEAGLSKNEKECKKSI